MKTKIQEHLLDSAVRAYNEENTQKVAWEREARFWYGRALQAEFINEITPWMFLAIIVALVAVAVSV